MNAERVRGLVGVLLGLLVRVWLATLRVRVVVDPALGGEGDTARPWVLAFFHGTQFPLLTWRRRRPTAVLVSWSADGAIQARALARQGMRVVRGSSSRGGARGLAALVRLVRRAGCDAAFAVDGPRGPYGVAKEGALVCARAVDARLVPMGSACRRASVARRAWDRYAVPWPFSEVAVALGAPLDPASTTPQGLSAAIGRSNAAAASALGVFESDSHPLVESIGENS